MENVIELNDLSRPELDVFARLTEAQLRNRLEPEKGIFIAESPKVIHRALDAGCRPLSLLMERRQLIGQGRAVIDRCGDVPVYTGERALLKELTGYTLTRGILCAMRRPCLPDVERLCAEARRVAVLENITDATNVGAIFRSAAALGMDAVLVTPSCCDPLCRRAVRVSMGAVFQIPWGHIGEDPADWPEAGLNMLGRLGFQTAAMALREDALSVDAPELRQTERLAVVLGTEGDGLGADTIARCDYTVRIPMERGVDSLNVAAASAVAFWQLGRGRACV
ncbi:MAG: RNA methyltransferase [Oscillospiraceae bacterium]|nr:RNA methyltransferase [Oscillospiraceae bacterium]